MATVEVFEAGHCRSFLCLARRADPWRVGNFPATFGLIESRGGEIVLFDTGYARNIDAAMRRFPFPLYRTLLPITLGTDAVETLRLRGIGADAVGTIVISHFHPDHIGGLRDFPQARFVCSREAWDDVRGKTGLAGLRRGFLGDLLPPDFESRLLFAEDFPAALDAPASGAHAFVAGSERMVLVPLAGHCAGHLGLIVERSDGRRVLFAGDAVWRLSCIDDGIGPHAIGMAIQHDRRAYASTIDLLARMKREDPALVVVAAHDPAHETA
jgi:glyoxylase-like metal-dependent hydrolase (beta-lactamase superfamily II)